MIQKKKRFSFHLKKLVLNTSTECISESSRIPQSLANRFDLM